MSPLMTLVGAGFGALIGYLANRVAIWMLFHPVREVRIGPLRIQGVFPKKKKEIAERIAGLLSSKLVTREDLEEIAARVLEEKVAALLPLPDRSLLKKGLAEIAGVLVASLLRFLPGTGTYDLRDYVVKKMNEYSDEEFESMFKEAVGKELVYISINDAIIGALVGAVEATLLASLHGL